MTFSEELDIADGHRIKLQADPAGQKVTDWANQHRDAIDQILLDRGMLLIRGLKILSSKQFGMVLSALFGEELLDYTYRSTPRTELRGKVYTATEYPAEETIPQHNENAYANKWALRLGFLCMQPAQTGGETPLADSRLVYQRIDPEIREKFERKGIMYVRNYSDLDLPWQEVFQTSDRAMVERYCADNGLTCEWLGQNRLRTRQINPAVANHPETGETVWFNQAHLFHVSSLKPEVREALLSLDGEEHLPRNTYFADGSPIPAGDLEHIRGVYESLKIQFRWERYDLLLLDNMLFSHGRNPFQGERKVLVGMARLHAKKADATPIEAMKT